MFWDQEALSAPHTQREIDMIEQATPTAKELHALRVKLDRAQSEVSRLEQELAAEKALADRLDTALLHAQDIIRAASRQLKGKHGSHTWGGWYLEYIEDARATYRKARGL